MLPWETKPPPGQCDDGFWVRCCTNTDGRTYCLPRWYNPANLAIFGTQVIGGEQSALPTVGDLTSGLYKPPDPAADAGAAYAAAREKGYKGTPAEFAAEWARYKESQKGYLDKLGDQFRPDAKGFDKLLTYTAVGLGAGVAWAWYKGTK